MGPSVSGTFLSETNLLFLLDYRYPYSLKWDPAKWGGVFVLFGVPLNEVPLYKIKWDGGFVIILKKEKVS